MNGLRWKLIPVEPGEKHLLDKSGARRLAATDLAAQEIYYNKMYFRDNVFESIHSSMQFHPTAGDLGIRIIVHEIGHCAIYSYNLLYDIHKVVKEEYWAEAEEWLCNYLCDYGMLIFNALCQTMGINGIVYTPVAISDAAGRIELF